MPNAFVQTYQYDSLYRLKEANEKAGATENWKQDFTYDRYDNRLTHNKFINGSQITHNQQTHPSIDASTNRFSDTNQFGYDKAGNLIADNGRTFTFDGNNKQILVTSTSGTVGEYFYDGDGMRVKKHVYTGGNHTKTVIFVYSGGKLVEEYSTDPVTSPKIKYLTEDHLGTPRIITDGTGELVSRRDFMPFGQEIAKTTGTRSDSSYKYSSDEDDVKQKFTGYQQDSETMLDFAEARIYENRHARFTAVDPLLASGKSGNPQTFNRYVYVGNRPLVFTDKSGLIRDWVRTKSGNVHYDSRVKGNKSARKYYGKGATRLRSGYSYNSRQKDKVILRKNGIVNINGVDRYQRDEANFSKKAPKPDETIKEVNKLQVVVFESTLFTEFSLFDKIKGPTGHVAFGINNETYSWDNTGYEANRGKLFSDYLNDNFSYRAGTVFELDFGSSELNQAAAEEIRLGPRNRTELPAFFPSGYNMITNNCGETLCRIEERLALPERSFLSDVTPSQHFNYINTTLRPYIVDQQRIEPSPRFFLNPTRVPTVPQPLPSPVN